MIFIHIPCEGKQSNCMTHLYNFSLDTSIHGNLATFVMLLNYYFLFNCRKRKIWYKQAELVTVKQKKQPGLFMKVLDNQLGNQGVHRIFAHICLLFIRLLVKICTIVEAFV